MPESKAAASQRLLILHPNFPGQFKHLARAAADLGHDVRFLCQTHYNRSIPGVLRLKLKGTASRETLLLQAKSTFEQTKQLADQYKLGVTSLRKGSWTPDVVISHSGWGCGLFVKEFWPQCRHVAYLEWWFNPTSEFYRYDPENLELGIHPKATSTHWLRNQPLALELCAADAVVAPTEWQRQQLPSVLQKRCQIVHDGIDMQTFRPAEPSQRHSNPLLTYGTRGMEPLRGFPQFIRALPELLQTRPNLCVEIAGEDSGGGSPPKAFSSWGSWAKQFLESHGVADQVNWLGHLPLTQYVNWLQRSWCHVYLTHPFVASWSLRGSSRLRHQLLVSDVAPVREFCEGQSNVSFVDHRKPQLSLHLELSLEAKHGTRPCQQTPTAAPTLLPGVVVEQLEPCVWFEADHKPLTGPDLFFIFRTVSIDLFLSPWQS